MRLLIIDDDPHMRETLAERLGRETFAIDTAADGEKGSYLARTNLYDAILLDNLLPKKNGLEVCEEIRQAGKSMPILVISVNGTYEEKVKFLDRGADDYITKPFSFRELRSRIRAHLRRPYEIKAPVMVLGDISLDSNKQKVTKHGKEIYLTRKEFLLLECLMRQKGDVLSRGTIMEHVWNDEGDPFSNTIEAHILNLRRKIDNDKKKLIKTVPGRGYKFDIDS